MRGAAGRFSLPRFALLSDSGESWRHERGRRPLRRVATVTQPTVGVAPVTSRSQASSRSMRPRFSGFGPRFDRWCARAIPRRSKRARGGAQALRFVEGGDQQSRTYAKLFRPGGTPRAFRRVEEAGGVSPLEVVRAGDLDAAAAEDRFASDDRPQANPMISPQKEAVATGSGVNRAISETASTATDGLESQIHGRSPRRDLPDRTILVRSHWLPPAGDQAKRWLLHRSMVSRGTRLSRRVPAAVRYGRRDRTSSHPVHRSAGHRARALRHGGWPRYEKNESNAERARCSEHVSTTAGRVTPIPGKNPYRGARRRPWTVTTDSPRAEGRPAR